MKTRMRRFTTPCFALVLAFAIAACAGDAGSGTEPSDTSGSTSEMDMSSEEMEGMSEDAAADSSEGGDVALNEADVTFLQMMIPHHEQANEMAEMVETNTDRPELGELASTILSTQSAEIERMQGLLEAAGENPEMHGSDMDGMDMPGMMDDSRMAELMQLQGSDFDLAFVDMMTEHHSGAIEMAQTLLDDGENPEVAQLAQEIIDAQEAEIAQMAEWREQWGLGPESG